MMEKTGSMIKAGLSSALVLGCFAPALAFADTRGDTAVKWQMDESAFNISVPTTIHGVAKADGALQFADNAKFVNESIFDVYGAHYITAEAEGSTVSLVDSVAGDNQVAVDVTNTLNSQVYTMGPAGDHALHSDELKLNKTSEIPLTASGNIDAAPVNTPTALFTTEWHFSAEQPQEVNTFQVQFEKNLAQGGTYIANLKKTIEAWEQENLVGTYVCYDDRITDGLQITGKSTTLPGQEISVGSIPNLTTAIYASQRSGGMGGYFKIVNPTKLNITLNGDLINNRVINGTDMNSYMRNGYEIFSSDSVGAQSFQFGNTISENGTSQNKNLSNPHFMCSVTVDPDQFLAEYPSTGIDAKETPTHGVLFWSINDHSWTLILCP